MNDIKEIQKDIGEIRVSQARMEKDVAYHIRRTDLNEARLKILEDLAEKVKEAINNVLGGMRLISWVVGGISALVGILKVMEFFLP